jgi:N-acetylneuraminate synthase
MENMSQHTFIVAEAGVNHNGSLERALALVDAAAEAGADCVKFQTFTAKALVTAKAERAGYQTQNLQEQGSQLSMLQKLELSHDAHHAIVARCKARGIRFMSTAFDPESLAFLATLDMPYVKIPSGDITAGPLVFETARLGRPLLVSTGMATLAETEAALGVIAYALTNEGAPRSQADCVDAYASAAGAAALGKNVTLLHCTTEYPAPFASVNLAAMDTLHAAFGLPVGYSDHTVGIEVSVAAVARGATVIEKHFTMDRSLPGPDHAGSLEPGELRAMVQAIRNVESAIGSPRKVPGPEEGANKRVARRSIVAARPILKGASITADDIAIKRPEGGASPMRYWNILGSVATRDYDADELIDGQ